MTWWSHTSLLKHLFDRKAQCTWSKSCLPVVLGSMANSSSASMVVTRTFICQRKHSHWDTEGKRSPAVHLSVSLEKHKYGTCNNWVIRSCNHFVCSLKQFVGFLTAKWPKRVFLTFFCSTRSIQSQEVGGDYNQKMKPTVYFRLNWEHGVHSMMHKH